MKILLLGHNGYLGSYLYNYLQTDILEERNAYYNGKEYNYVINCIGTPDVEFCENNIKETNYSNWLIIEDIIRYYPNAKIINFSSYYVYDDDGLCNETSNVTHKYMYMNQKLNSEKIIKNGVTFRLGKLFGNKQQKQNKLIDYILNNDNLILDSVLFNPTSLHQILKIIKYELKNNIFNGLFNLSNLGVTTSYDLGVFTNELLGTNKHITKIDKIQKSFHNYGSFLMDVSLINSIYPLTDWKKDYKKYILC